MRRYDERDPKRCYEGEESNMKKKEIVHSAIHPLHTCTCGNRAYGLLFGEHYGTGCKRVERRAPCDGVRLECRNACH